METTTVTEIVTDNATASHVENLGLATKAQSGRSRDWILFIAGMLFILALWLLAKVLAWFIPGFRPIYNRIFVISVPTILTG